MPWVLVLVFIMAWQFRVISPLRCICKNSWPNGISKLDREFPSRSLRKGEESRARIAVDQENRSNQLAGWPHQSESNHGVKNPLIMKNWIWWWRQNWNGAAMSIRTSKRGSASKSRELKRTTDFSEGVRLLIWFTKLQSMEPWQKGKEQHSFTERKTGECFQRKTIGSCSRRDTCSILHTHATGDREDNVGWNGETQEDLAWRKHPLQYRKWRNRLTWTACTVQRLVMWLKLKNPLCMAGKMKNIVA